MVTHVQAITVPVESKAAPVTKLSIGGYLGRFHKSFSGHFGVGELLSKLSLMVALPAAFSREQIYEFARVEGDSEATLRNLSAMWNWSYEWDRNLRINGRNVIYSVGKKRRNSEGSGNFRSTKPNKANQHNFVWADWDKKMRNKFRSEYVFIGRLSRKRSLKWMLKLIEMDLEGKPGLVYVNDGDWSDIEEFGIVNGIAGRVKPMKAILPGHYIIAAGDFSLMFADVDGGGLKFVLDNSEVFMCATPRCFCASGEYMSSKLKHLYGLWKVWRVLQEKCDFEVIFSQSS